MLFQLCFYDTSNDLNNRMELTGDDHQKCIHSGNVEELVKSKFILRRLNDCSSIENFEIHIRKYVRLYQRV